MKTTLTCDRRLSPNVALRICERNELGELVGFWTGYWIPNRQLVRLYPAANPYCIWQVSRAPHNVCDRLVSVPKEESKRSIEKTSTIKSSTAQVTRELIGQVKIKI